MELGSYKVQGLDYAYTLQGWLKGVNGQFISGDGGSAGADMSGDGFAGSPFSTMGRDVFAYSLGYFNGTTIHPDYEAIGGSNALAFGMQYSPTGDGSTGANLFNGNISTSTYAIANLENNATVGYSYRYDQLNRLVTTYKHDLTSGLSTWDNSTINTNYDYAESETYDGNGNILTYNRNASTNANPPALARRASPGRMGSTQTNRLAASFASNSAMDRMTYNYNVDDNNHLLNNRLRHVNDSVDPDAFSVDIDDQQPDNYAYDHTGNLTGDMAEGIYKVNWTVYGKLATLNKTDGTALTYAYDPSGNRITKAFTSPNGQDYNSNTYYVRDAQGNVLGVYTTNGDNSYNWKEQHLYGSSRLGMVSPYFQITSDAYLPNDSYNDANDPVTNAGNRTYELTNHLGNVLATINDLPVPVDDYNTAYVLSSQDYYPFGMLQPGRTATNSEIGYRYGFNGKEKDDEVKGEGNQIDMGDRWLDVRLGRTPKTDAKAAMYPGVSPYAYVMNSPINAVDPDGKVVIFINGYYGFPTKACCGGTEKYWGSNWIKDAQKRIGDHKARYYDGSLGGASGVLFGDGDPVFGNSSSMDPATRRLAGYNLGKTEASDIVNNLQKDEHGNIIESIKFVTSSMGTAYQRGVSQAIVDYVSEQNTTIDAYNSGLVKNKDGSYVNPALVKPRLNVNMEYTVDIDAFQGSEIGTDPNSKANYYMVNDGAESNFIGSPVKGSTQIGTDKKGKTTMHGHHPSWADPATLPKGTQNPTGTSKKENPSD